MSFVIASLNVLAIGALAWWLATKTGPQHRLIFWTALIFKLVAGVILGVVYFYYYGVGDTIGFFSDAIRLAELLRNNPQEFFNSLFSGTPPIELVNNEPRSFFFTTLVAFANISSGDNYWISSLWFSMFSFACTWYLLACVSRHMPELYKAAVIAFLFLPSVVFWSAGIIKESVGFGSLCFLTGIFISLLNGRRPAWYEYFAAAGATWLLLSLKYYWAAVFFPSVFATLIVHWFLSKRLLEGWQLGISWALIFVISCVATSFTHPNFYLGNFLEVIRLNHAAFVAISKPDNLIHYPREIMGWGDLVINAPWALFSGLFRPLPFETASITGILSSVENALVLVLAVAVITNLGKSESARRLFWFSMVTYVCLLCIFLAQSTPNFGTLSRYRIGLMPFFVMLIIHDNPLLKRTGLTGF